jgi:hypothetical protein
MKEDNIIYSFSSLSMKDYTRAESLQSVALVIRLYLTKRQCLLVIINYLEQILSLKNGL